MRRRLTQSERAVWAAGTGTPVNAVVAARIGVAAEEDQLRAAIRRLCERHPGLRTRITGRVLTTADVDVPPVRVTDGDWRTVVEAEVQTPFAFGTGPLSRFVLLPAADHHHLVIVGHHLVADGLSLVQVLRDLLDPPDGPPVEIPAPTTEELVLAGALGDAGTTSPTGTLPSAPVPGRPAAGPAPTPGAGQLRVLAWSLTPEQTAAVVAGCTAAGTTVYGALCAAFLRAFADLDGSTTVRRVEVPVSLRPMLGTAVDKAYGLYMATVTVAVDLADEPDFWSAARTIRRRLVALAAPARLRADVLLARRVLRLIPTPLLRRLARRPRPLGYDLSISNLGRLTFAEGSPSRQVESLHLAVSIAAPNHRVLGVATVGGRLCCTLTSYDHALARQVKEIAITQLLKAVRG
ncbi:condensation domain-containing protein [Micromonospora sp. M71_S20]|uniref:condensation domain-containing protein n=1 Tax=Micromonospora sp. M71_S20 TaxID=592872 RepID=UPI000F128275|nr:condensation domain-containing protein [Micromonospora sp. M71_S20]RLK09556.1 condensation domain-containing protein [Micromonospora sp. M71_S20]